MELNESAISPAAEARVRNAVETAAIDREWEPELYELLKEYDRRATEIEWLRAALDAADGPVGDGVHALALGSIARDVGLTSEASGALVALTVADRIEELARLRTELEEYEPLTEQACPAGEHATWLVDSERQHACPWCEITRLRAALDDVAELCGAPRGSHPDNVRIAEWWARAMAAPAPAREQTDPGCGCRLGPDQGGGKARGVEPCSAHVTTGPEDFDG